ncbi:hypothetical protein J2T57_001719 [Natronocella acetinitrilica]|uniref:DUF922 domain-containing protein n=1 Tax=Natronocella acetinitrilica TaxID=414046 RepID=A0AAE3KFZ0_9GAMM|nr:hypothetical protein [Natronocella acetinitrilica]MCP1674617.1 hypothetical protein [Natronocella acetinitrilica]
MKNKRGSPMRRSITVLGGLLLAAATTAANAGAPTLEDTLRNWNPAARYIPQVVLSHLCPHYRDLDSSVFGPKAAWQESDPVLGEMHVAVERSRLPDQIKRAVRVEMADAKERLDRVRWSDRFVVDRHQATEGHGYNARLGAYRRHTLDEVRGSLDNSERHIVSTTSNFVHQQLSPGTGEGAAELSHDYQLAYRQSVRLVRDCPSAQYFERNPWAR